MNVLVTGGAGYIGSAAVEQLIDNSHRVVVLDNLDRGHRDAVHKDAVFVEGTLACEKTVSDIIQKHGIEAILHFAASSQVGESMENPAKYFTVNVADGLSLIKTACKNKIRKFILSSTAATYGEPLTVPITEEHVTAPTNPYGESKLILEKFLKWFYECHGMEYISLRYFNACGATVRFGEDHTPETHLIPLILMAASGERGAISVFGDDYDTPDGTCIRDYVHIYDLASAHILALNAKGSNIYNLGNGHGFSVNEVIQAARAVTGKPIKTAVAPRRAGDPAKLVASSDKIKKDLSWTPRYTDLAEIIETAWQWKCEHPKGYAR
ncbi:MAG: UDP-glucose 4-epimerase GalE [Candidatus Auribacter fodinae]|jgi:UDP-glucose 4-epimerase|uniref:UDP-glucose 4-epimerase n=1 Tax=Candidatus Auribacter fodinae TaxID=2093366 RepID=A0A3A4R4I4_9BACT|nr:MAG: UDP-glucose 4-epimerase GalE [Candidatus Auribacter fodinae]